MPMKQAALTPRGKRGDCRLGKGVPKAAPNPSPPGHRYPMRLLGALGLYSSALARAAPADHIHMNANEHGCACRPAGLPGG